MIEGTTSNENWQQSGRELLKSEEVLQLPPRTAITFTPGVPPIMTNLVRYYEEPELFKSHQADWLARTLSACNTLGRSFVLLVFSLILAWIMTVAVTNGGKPAPAYRQQSTEHRGVENRRR